MKRREEEDQEWEDGVLPHIPRRERRRQEMKEYKLASKRRRQETAQRDRERYEKETPCFTFHQQKVPRQNISSVAYDYNGVRVCKGVEMGWSLRATKAFPKGSLVTQYVGVLVTREEVDRWPQSAKTHLYSLQGGLLIDGIKEPKEGFGCGSFANHSSKPNVKFWGDAQGVFLRAIVDISPGEWIMANYKSALTKELFDQL